MDWKPITRAELQEIIDRDLAECRAEERGFFRAVAIEPARWHQSPWGDEGGGFWAVAVADGKVLWYNDIEHGFNVSRFQTAGAIPTDKYWCNQDTLGSALSALATDRGSGFGPPRSTG